VSIIETFVPQIALNVAGSGGADGSDESGTALSLVAPLREEGGGAVRRFTKVGDSKGSEEWISPRLLLPDRGVL
jgi:hypothetical protein